MNLIKEILHEIVAIMPLIVTLASTITAITNTPHPHGKWGKLYKIIELLALVTNKTKQQ